MRGYRRFAVRTPPPRQSPDTGADDHGPLFADPPPQRTGLTGATAARNTTRVCFVVLVHRTQADTEALREEVAHVLQPLGLRLSPAKTRVAHMSDGFDFLGFHLQ
jgi:hypothetical protein